MYSPTVFEINSPAGLATALSRLLAQVITLQMRTKGCHWHVTGAQFRSLHALFDEQADDLAALADEIAERARALDFTTIASLADVSEFYPDAVRQVPLPDAAGMLAELRRSNLLLREAILAVRRLAEDDSDIVSVALTDGWLAATEKRTWILAASMPEGSR